MEEKEFVCNLGAMSEGERGRHETVIAQLRGMALGVEELGDGYAFRFAPDAEIAQLAAEFIGRERLCCPFLRLTIEFEPDGGPLWLRLTGREGVKPFLHAELGLDGGR